MGYLRHGKAPDMGYERAEIHHAAAGTRFDSGREHEHHPECLSAGNGLRSLSRASDRGQVTCG